jgi:translocation and assembly module TamB
LLPALELKLNSLRLDPSWLGLQGEPLMARGQGRDGLWRLQLAAPQLDSAVGRFGLRGTVDARWGAGDPLLELDSQFKLQRLDSTAPPVAIKPLKLVLKREPNALVLGGRAELDGQTPVEFKGRWTATGLNAELSIQDLPLQSLDPNFGGEFAGTFKLDDKPDQPKFSARFSLLQPSVGGLQAPELWQGQWQPGSLRLASASTEVVARLKGNRLESLRVAKGDGTISVVPNGDGYRWAARQWALAPLHLGLRGNRPLPLNGVLDGNGRLGLDPLLLQGRATVTNPALAWIKGRQLELTGFLRYPRFDLSAEVLPQGSGSVQLSSRGAWNGPLDLQAKARKLQPGGVLRLLQDLRRPAAQRPDGRASDLGEFAIDTLGSSLDAQILALQEAQERLAEERPPQRNDGRIALGDVEGLIDADLSVSGAKPSTLWLKLAARGHLWLRGDDRDTALQLEPFVAELNGPLGSGDGSFSFAGLPLGFLALLTPVPAGLRGALRGTGNWRIGQGLPTLTLDLALQQATLAGQALSLERGRLSLDGRLLDLDLSLRGGESKNTVDLVGTVPLDPVEKGFELRASSRGDGLVFLTSLVGDQVQWQQGSLDLQLLARGTLAEPIVNGFLRVDNGALVLAGQTVDAVQATVFFDFQQLELERFTARSGEGSLTGSGSLAFQQEADAPGLNFTVKSFPIRRPDAQLQLDGALTLQGSLSQPALGGEVKLSKGAISVSPSELSSGGGPGVPVDAEIPEAFWDFQKPVVVRGPRVESADAAALRRRVPRLGSLSFRNLRVALGPDLRITAPPIAQFLTGGLLTFNGSAGPDVRISGVVRLLKGRISLLTNVLKLDSSNANVAVFTPSLGLLPYLDVAFTTRISDRVGGFDGNDVVGNEELQGNFSNLDRLNLIKVIVAYSGPADRLSLDTLSLRSQPPLPQERLVALLAGNSLAGIAAGNAGTAVATLLGGTLLSPVLGGLGNLFDNRITASLYPAFLEPYVQDSGKDGNQGRVPSQLVLGAEVGVDLTDRFNFSVLAAPNRSDIPAEAVLRYQATDKLGIQGALDQQGRWQSQLQLFFRF